MKAEDKGDRLGDQRAKDLDFGRPVVRLVRLPSVRTDPTAKKHDGISFMLIDMHQAQIETRPIRLIAGASPFCETFFTAARAEKDALLGQLNVGWTVGKRLLQHERASQTGAPGGGGAAAPRPCRTSPSTMSAWTSRAAWPTATCAPASRAT